MEEFRIYSITDEYISFLQEKHPNVYSNKIDNRTHTRKYIGTVININGVCYYIPMSSPKESDYQIAGQVKVIKKSIVPIIRIVVKNSKKEKELKGTLRVSHMIPVPISELIEYDIEEETDDDYKELVKDEWLFIRRNKEKIIKFANVMYKQKIENCDIGYVQSALDYKELEQICMMFEMKEKVSYNLLNNKEIKYKKECGMKEELHSGEIYYPNDDSIMEEQLKCLDRLYDFNATRPSEMEKRAVLLKEMFGDIGENCYLEPPFHANWGGRHCHFGKNVYANFGLTCVDDTHIYVGDYTMFGPNVVLATAGHPVCPELREKGYQYNMPIHIGKNCWLGAGVIVLPGVTIGDNVVIGAGSVVTKDIPSGVVVVGNPCKVLREISEHDYEFYFKDRKIPEEMRVK